MAYAKVRPEVLREIHWRGAPLRERIEILSAAPPAAPSAAPHADAAPDPNVARRWRLWAAGSLQDADAGPEPGDSARWRERAARAEWNPQAALAALSDAPPPHASSAAAPPSWTDFLLRALDLVPSPAAGGEPGAPEFLRASDPLPFEQLLAPFVLAGIEALEARVPSAVRDRFAPAAHSSLRRHLLRELTIIAGPTLHAIFDAFRAKTSTGAYALFVADCGKGLLIEIFKSRPVLPRILSLTVEFWVESISELLQRFAADDAFIRDTIFHGAELGRVAAAEPGMSDSHARGRMVCALTFESGDRVIYKPRDLRLDQNANRLIEWFNQISPEPGLRTLRVASRPTHGWVEFARHDPLPDAAAAARYYKRAGALAAIVTALDGTDCHFENLIASGEHPLLIDVEALLYPVSAAGEPPELDEASAAVFRFLTQSALNTGFFPRLESGPGGAYDSSAVGGVEAKTTHTTRPEWLNVNTDAMELGTVPYVIPQRANAPILYGAAVDPNLYLDHLIAGFRLAYRALIARRTELLATGSPLWAMRERKTRFVFRATRIYSLFLKRLLAPEHMTSGAERSIELEKLARPYLNQPSCEPFWPLLEDELDALERLDIPHFLSPMYDESVLLESGAELKGRLKNSPLEKAFARLNALSERDLAIQERLIRESMLCRPRERSGPGAGAGSDLPGWRERDAPSSDFCLATAAGIAEELWARAILTEGGGAAWFSIEAEDEDSSGMRVGIQPLDPWRLYDGAVGPGLFFAALARATGRADHADWADAAFRPGVNALRGLSPEPTREGPPCIGGAAGWGSLVYALTLAGDLLRRDDLRDAAALAVDRIKIEAIQADTALDIVSGSAGALLGLLAFLESARGDVPAAEGARSKARACADRLISAAEATPGGPRAWKTLGGKFLGGFSHGASGIALALARMAAFEGGIGRAGSTQRAERNGVAGKAWTLAAEALAYEGTLFDESRGEWLDLRREAAPGAPQPVMTSWCHGSPGMGLGRLAMMDLAQDAKEIEREIQGRIESGIERDIERALAAARAFARPDLDHLCCGHFGRIELLAEASRALGRPELLEDARRMAGAVLDQATLKGPWFVNTAGPRGIQRPGFFQGLAGIGYGWLRLADPAMFPCVAVLESSARFGAQLGAAGGVARSRTDGGDSGVAHLTAGIRSTPTPRA